MRLKRCVFALVATLMCVFTSWAQENGAVARIGSTDYATFDEAVTAANGMTGDVTVEVYGKVEYASSTPDLTGAYDSISFVGKTTDAEISITRNGSNGYISGSTAGNDCNVSFSNLILSKPAGSYVGDAGFMNVYFCVYRTGAVTYTDCTFPDGACAQSTTVGASPVVYNNCTFANTVSGEYSLWVYANCKVTVSGGRFTGVRGVKMYAEGAATTSNLTLSEVEFTSKVTEKPAIVLTYGESVTLSNNTYNNVYNKTGTATTFELDLEGNPNGTTVVSDASVTCYNDKGTCGVMVGEKIYTTVADAAAVATAGETVQVLYSTTDTAEFVEDVILKLASGVTAPNVTVGGSAVADLEGEGTEASPYLITDKEELVWFASDVNAGNNYSGKYIKVTATEIDLANDEWTPIGYMGKSFKGNFNGNGVVIKNLKITKELTNTAANNGIGFFGRTDSPAVIENFTISNVDITGSLYVGAVVGNGYTGKKVENITVNGNITIDAWWYAGVIGGKGYMALVNDCKVVGESGSYVKGNNGSYIGGIWGFRGEGDNKITNCSVKGVDIIGVDRVGGICGIGHYGNTVSECTAVNVTVTATNPEATTVGLIVGATQGTTEQPTVITGNKLTSTTARINNGDGTYTEVNNLYGTNINGYTPVTNYVAQVGSNVYEDLQDAIDNVTEDGTVILLADVTVTEPAYGYNALNHPRAVSFTFDLNGKTLSADTGDSVFCFNISGSGATSDVTVTIKNGKVVAGANTWCALMASGIDGAKAIMNLEDLIVENNKGGDLAVKAWANAVVNAKNVTINANYGGGFYALGGEIVLDDCTVNQKGLWTAPYLSVAVGVSNGGKLTVNSGAYSTEPLAVSDGDNQGTSHGSWGGALMSSGGTLIINGGTFSNANYGDVAASNPRELFTVGADADYGDNVAAHLEINGGIFNSIGALMHCETIWGSNNDAANTYMPTMNVVITGGDFTGVAGKTVGGCDPISTDNPVEVAISGGTYGANHTIDNSYLAEGCEVLANADGTYSVVERTLTGEGTEESPYMINNIDDLHLFAQNVNGGNNYAGEFVKLGASIDLSAQAVMLMSAEVTPNWEAVGTKAAPFKGTFDGNNETISNMIVVGEANQGFFGYADNATIKNLKLENVTVIGIDCVGAVAGQVYSVSLVDNCHVSGTIQVEGQTNVGGIVGKYYTKVTNCSVIGDGVATSYVKGVYVASDFEGDNIGGIMGHCGENNSLTGNTVKNITISGTRKVAGIVGIADQNTDIDNCVVENVVVETTATVDYASSKLSSMSIGALIGQYQAAKATNDGTVTNSTVKNVTFKNVNVVTVDVGPIVGGARGGSGAMLAPSADITATGNNIQLATITGYTNLYLMSPVAKIGNAEYYTFEAALEAAQPNETIVLLGNVECAEKPVYEDDGIVNVDVNGYMFVATAKERVRNVASADGAVASNNIKFVSGFGWEVYTGYDDFVASEENNFRVFPTLQEAVDYNPETTHDVARIYPYEDVKQTSDVTLRTGLGTASTICLDPGYDITWDLNGYTLLQETPTGNPLETCIRGTFTLDDTSAAKTGKWIAGACGVKDSANSWYGAGGPAFYVLGAGKLILKGGTVSIARYINNNGETIDNTGGLVRVDSGSLLVDGATLLVEDTYGIMAWGGSVVVNSGKFDMQGNGASSVFAMKYYADASVEINTYIDGELLIYNNATATVNAQGVKYYVGSDYVAPTLAEGLVGLPNLDGRYVVGSEPTATVNNLGSTTVAANDYMVYGGGSNTTDMPLSFVMQFLADQDEEDMETSAFADWYGDFVITFTGIENGSFSADGCYLAGNYDPYGWVKIPVDDMEIEEGVRYPVMLSMWDDAQTYETICTSVKDFKCALYLTPEVLAANPNLKVNLELSVIDSSKGSDAAAKALVSGENVYEVVDYDYNAIDFALYEGADVVIEDGTLTSFSNPNTIVTNSITYKRTCNNLYWNPLYVPFQIPVEKLTEFGLEVVCFNCVHTEEGDDTKMYTEFRKITGGTLRANYPYLFRRTSSESAIAIDIILNGATLYSTSAENMKSVKVSSAFIDFEIKGTYTQMSADDLGESRILGATTGRWVYLDEAYKLNPFRVYLTATASGDSPVVTELLRSIQFRVVDEEIEGATGVTSPESVDGETVIYDLQGRRVLEPGKGVYIVNGKKVIFK